MCALGCHVKNLTKVGLALHRSGGLRGYAEDLVGILGDDSELVGLSFSQGRNSEEIICYVSVVTFEPAALTSQSIWLALDDVAHNGTATVVQRS